MLNSMFPLLDAVIIPESQLRFQDRYSAFEIILTSENGNIEFNIEFEIKAQLRSKYYSY